MNNTDQIRSAALVAACTLVIGLLLLAGGPQPARACSTPVFRYAMYRWPPAPYYVFYLHHGEISKEDAAINKAIGEAFNAKTPANVSLEAVDATQEEQFNRLPKEVRSVWESRTEKEQPLHVVFSPWGAKLFAGRLDAKQLGAMLDSPMRKQLGKLFDDGSAMVLLVLTGPDKKANKQAEKVAGEVVAMAAGGEIPVSGGDDPYSPDQFLPEEPQKPEESGDTPAEDDQTPAEDKQQEDSPPTLKVGVLKVARADLKEAWLVRMLLSVEPDLGEFPKKAMIFTVYGRGRAMPPYVGKGISAENLADCVAFLAAACSCTVKDQNPGMDLLVKRDWDATAEKMAADDPEFAGESWDYEEFEPAEDVPADTEPESQAGDATPAEETPKVDQPTDEKQADEKQAD